MHYKLYLVSKVAAKVRADASLEPENFRGEGTAQMSAKKKKKCLNFTDNEFEVLHCTCRCTPFYRVIGVSWEIS